MTEENVQFIGARQLSNDEKAMMNELKRTSALFLAQLEIVRQSVQAQYQKAHSDEGGAEQLRLDDAEPFRWLAMARTDMQHACMFACRAVAQPAGNS